MSICIGPHFAIFSSTVTSLDALKQIEYYQHHEHFRKIARIKKLRFIPVWICSMFIENFGKDGYISFIEFDKSIDMDIYTVIFDRDTRRTKLFYAESELDFF